MPISGVLEQLPFVEFIQTLSNLGRSGKLSLSRFGERGTIFLRDGRIIGAASSSVRETLGSLLIGQYLITEEQLSEALEVQRKSDDPKRLGAILIEQGALSDEQLRQAVRQQTQRVVREFMKWKHGFFEFEPLEVEPDEVEVDVVEMFLGDGLSAEAVLLAGAVDIDHSAAEDTAALAEELADEPPGEVVVDRVTMLRDLMLEIRSPEFTGELMAKLMDYSSEIVPRGVLLSIQGGVFCGMSLSIGERPSSEMIEAVRDLKIPVGESSILAEAAARHGLIRRELRDEPNDLKIIECLGGVEPQEAVAMPIVVHDRVEMVFYGDSGDEEAPIEALAELELVMLQIGAVMEGQVLEEAVSSSDMTQAEATLEVDSFRSLLDSDPEPMALVKADCRILYANPAMASMLGQDVEELTGAEILDSVNAEDGQVLKEVVHEVSRGGAPGGSAVRFLEADGAERRCYLLPTSVGIHAGDRCVMLRALTAGEVQGRFDPLTGLMDHEAFVERLERSVSRATHEEGEPFALLLVGLSNFMMVNVEFGWGVGNEILRSVGHRLTLNLRPGDLVSRGLGDTFCILLEKIRAAEDGELVAERVQEFVGRPFEVAGKRINVATSIGVVTSDGSQDSAEVAIQQAEVAMKAAKKQGGRAIVVHQPQDEEVDVA